MNIAAPDEGNMHMLETIATDGQKEQYLRPLAAGEVRSCFAMTEPVPGAGSDPSALTTSAEWVPGSWRIEGRKWFSTGADGAGFTICMARTASEPGDNAGATMFLVDAGNPGMKIVRHIETHVVQICGSLGVSGDILLSRFLREVRPFRIYDGPSETSRWGIARRVLRPHSAAVGQ